MNEPQYRVRMAEGLSKAYGLQKLKKLRDGGQLNDAAQCTADSGQSWVTLNDLLSTDTSGVTVTAAAPKRPGRKGQSESSTGSSHLHEISELRERLTAEEMFERRGRLSPNSLREDLPDPSTRSGVSSKAASTKKVKNNRSDASDVAASALRTIRKKVNESSTKNVSPVPHVEKQHGQKFILFLSGVLGGLIGGGSIAAWATMPVDSKADVQNVSTPTRPQANRPPKLVLISYVPQTPTVEQSDTMDEIISQIGELVRTKGPDGRAMSSQTVDLFSERLSTLMAWPGLPTSSRAEAANDLAEKCKVLYLLQLHNTRSDDPEQQEKGRRVLLEATDQGLSKLFPEFAANDLRFMEIFKAAAPDVQPELMLIRYWYYRSLNRPTADEWLKRMHGISDENHLTYVANSIAEVNNIE